MNPNFKKSELLPVIVQHFTNKKVLMLGYMNSEAYEKTLESKHVWFFSRSKNRLWEKGESSKNFLGVKKIVLDCDKDAILILASPEGPTCHTLADSCFEAEGSVEGNFLFTLEYLEKIIEERKNLMPKGSYTTTLFEEGINKISKKVGEEASEVIIASLAEQKKDLIYESADLIYHLLVLLANEGIKLEEIIQELNKRHNK
tara:strand:+ start:3401 stop:4003 length:603 start_codon:yes stop_codon:yes gene_type:complete